MSQQMKKTMRRSVPNVNAGSEPRFEMDDQEDSALSFPFIPRTSSTVATDNAAAIVLAINWPALSGDRAQKSRCRRCPESTARPALQNSPALSPVPVCRVPPHRVTHQKTGQDPGTRSVLRAHSPQTSLVGCISGAPASARQRSAAAQVTPLPGLPTKRFCRSRRARRSQPDAKEGKQDLSPKAVLRRKGNKRTHRDTSLCKVI